MMQEQQTGKRIVSKGEYVKVQTLVLTLIGGIVVCGTGILLLLMSLFYFLFVEAQRKQVWDANGEGYSQLTYSAVALISCVCLAPLLLLAIFCLRSNGRKKWRMMQRMQPLTRANSADLPASDSLVRASEEPAQERGRAAESGHSKPEAGRTPAPSVGRGVVAEILATCHLSLATDKAGRREVRTGRRMRESKEAEA